MRRAIRGTSLIEILVGLAIVGALVAGLASVLAFSAQASLRDAARADRGEANAAIVRLLAARLGSVVLVPRDGARRDPLFVVERDRLRFVTRFPGPGPRPGPQLFDLRVTDGHARVTVANWPDGDAEETVTLAGDLEAIRSGPQPAAVDGLPAALIVQVAGVEHTLPLGAHVPLDCVISRPVTPAQTLLCPGLSR